MKVYLEHANITVKNLQDSIAFFKTAFPDFEIRGEGINRGYHWVHLGTDTYYLALNERSNKSNEGNGYDKEGINHLGFVVDNVAGLVSRLEAAGYERSYPSTKNEVRIREYFCDSNGLEFEFVEYLTNDKVERNRYDID